MPRIGLRRAGEAGQRAGAVATTARQQRPFDQRLDVAGVGGEHRAQHRLGVMQKTGGAQFARKLQSDIEVVGQRGRRGGEGEAGADGVPSPASQQPAFDSDQRAARLQGVKLPLGLFQAAERAQLPHQFQAQGEVVGLDPRRGGETFGRLRRVSVMAKQMAALDMGAGVRGVLVEDARQDPLRLIYAAEHPQFMGKLDLDPQALGIERRRRLERGQSGGVMTGASFATADFEQSLDSLVFRFQFGHAIEP